MNRQNGKCLSQINVALLIQVLHSAAKGILIVSLPLMMRDRNIDIVSIGLIFSAMPLVMQLGRIFFATLSDFWGRKLFFVLSGFFSLVSNSIYYVAFTPIEFLAGKISEGTKDGSLWAVNRAFILENNEKKQKALVNMKTVTYLSEAVGTLLTGFLIVWLLYEGALIMCALFGAFGIALSLFLVGEKKERFSAARALHFLNFSKKERIFKVFMILFFIMGLSAGPSLITGFLIPLFLNSQGFNAETIGVLIGSQTLLAGLFSYFFANKTEISRLILIDGAIFTATLIALGFSGSALACILVIFYGVVEGLRSVAHEGILARIAVAESYGTDIGLLMMGFHGGMSLSLAMTGFFVSIFGFATAFLFLALTFPLFYVTSYFILKNKRIRANFGLFDLYSKRHGAR